MAKIDNYLDQSIAAAEEVRQRGVWKIYNTGNVENDYRSIFETPDLTANPEILWFKMYDGDQVGNSVTRYLNTGGGNVGVTASLVDDYLTIDAGLWLGKSFLMPSVSILRSCFLLSETPVCRRLWPCLDSACNLLGLVIRTLSVSPRWLAMVQRLERT